MATQVVLNPTGPLTIAQGTSSFAAELVSGATIVYGGTSGGPYTGTYVVPAATVTADEASGNITIPLANVPLPEGISYLVATVSNAAGSSLVSDEIGIQILAVPAAPVFTVA